MHNGYKCRRNKMTLLMKLLIAHFTIAIYMAFFFDKNLNKTGETREESILAVFIAAVIWPIPLGIYLIIQMAEGYDNIKQGKTWWGK